MNNEEVLRMKQRFQIVGNCPELNRAIDVAIQVAPTDLSVLITGESGSGKENIPRIIHANSLRKSKQYIAVNCGSIPEGTVDSELFGHEKGAFTGAVNERKGYFDEADGGTIFLDEVAELPMATQARLLRVLETGEFIKVGSSKVEKTDVRIVAATNVDLQEAISQGRFREDLFYRLNTIPIKMPPLRERGTDILLLFRKFAADCSEKYRVPTLQLSDEAKQMLMGYHWPGNVRQLKNITEQMSIMATSRVITEDELKEYLPDMRTTMLPVATGGPSSAHSFENEREILYKVLFDLRRDVTDLKEQMQHLSGQAHSQASAQPVSILAGEHSTETVQHITQNSQDDDIQDTEVYVEETLSIDDVEKDLIRRALQKHNGRRKNAARELHISERTLYRKIKEYNLE
ncbi:MAG: sigma-54 dependent transcriptional regulator [Bacteroidaceae bacterium]|nr:sigma-54 dependent transcriptional regulator [Bacteroidaceae bacterium]